MADTIALINVLWLDQDENVIAGFEVEKSTSKLYATLFLPYKYEILNEMIDNYTCLYFDVKQEYKIFYSQKEHSQMKKGSDDNFPLVRVFFRFNKKFLHRENVIFVLLQKYEH